MAHNIQHALDSTIDHTMTATEGNIFTANANGLPQDSGYGAWKTISYTTADQTIYVSTTGSDETGDGSSGNPYATIQHVWDNVLPWYIYHDIVIQLADGTYTLSADLVLSGKLGDGIVTIQGNTADRTLVTIDGATQTYYWKIGTGVRITIQYLTVYQLMQILLYSKPLYRDAAYHYIYNCVIDSNIYGVYLNSGSVYVHDCDVTNSTYAGLAAADAAYILSRTNSSTVTNGTYGLWARRQALIAKWDATQPTGSTANEGTEIGGEIE